MKKRIISCILLLGLVMAAAGCGKKEDAQQTDTGTDAAAAAKKSVSAKDFDVDKYVTLGDYEGVEVEVPTYNYTEEDLDNEVQAEIDYYIQSANAYDYEKTDKEVVEEGDIVNIDYVGTKDGVAFDGGTAQGAHLEIGSGQFIDGFETGLIGHRVGKKVALELTFPENYHSTELAGQAVVFEVTINAIETKKTPELSDELVQSMNINLNSVEELRADIGKYLQQQCDERNQSEKKTAVWEAVYAKCTVSDPPEELVNDVLERISQNLKKYAEQYGVTEEELITNYMGTTKEQYDIDSRKSAISSAKEKLAAAAIAKKENITVSDEEIRQSAEKDAQSYGYSSADDVINEIGAGSYYDYVLGQKLDEFLLTKVTVKELEPVSMFSTTENVTE